MNQKTKYFFPVHLSGGNRGCEGIAKGTAMILGEDKTRLIGLCTDVPLDTQLGVDKYVSLVPSRKPSIIDRFMFHVYPRIMNQDKHRLLMDRYWYDEFLSKISSDDIMFSTGGDMLCYEDNFVSYTNNVLHERGVKTILWGCSMGKENLTPLKEITLHNFDLIYTRESLTESFLRSLGLKNVYCLPDPAFVLQPEETAMPDVFQRGDVIGINLSNFVVGDFELDTPFGSQVKELLDFILNETQFQVLLIPHVTWDGQDDRIVANNIKRLYLDNPRISVLRIDTINYCQIRYIISKCKLFIGARTHAVISAYSTCVPTLALGYSIKSKGIAKDLGISDQYVVNSRHNDAHILMDSFNLLLQNAEAIKDNLLKGVPDYANKPYKARNLVHELINN